MDKAKLYNEKNQLQTRDAEEIIEKFNKIATRKQSNSLIDIGTGSGDVLVKVVIKNLKYKIEEAVGVDISKPMIEYAKDKYEKQFLKFHCVDLLSEVDWREIESKLGIKQESFDIVTSFYCLHWLEGLKSLRKAFMNIGELLKPGGNFVCSILKTHEIFDAYCDAASKDCYSEYLHDLNRYLPPLHNIKDHVEVIENMLKETGFKIEFLQSKNDVFDYETRFNYKSSMTAVNPFINRMPLELQDKFMEDLSKHSKVHQFNESGYKIAYEILYVIAIK